MTWHPEIPDEYRNEVVCGDARELAKRLPDESVDLVFTDPPYPREFLPLYGWLAETAARVLKPGGLCVALAGHAHLPDVMNLMGSHLDFYWIGGMQHHGGTVARMIAVNMLCGWKPQVWYRKGKRGNPNHAWVFDLFQPSGLDKRYHRWGQAETHSQYYVDKLTKLGQTVFDPFTGGGTVPVVCKQLGRHCIAFELDPETAALARERVRLTPEPLFVLDAPDLQEVLAL